MKSLILMMAKPFLKRIARHIIQKEGDKLQKALKEKIRTEGPQAVDKLFDGVQAKVTGAVRKLGKIPFAGAFIEKIISQIDDKWDSLQAKVKAAAQTSADRVDGPFDAFQASIAARIMAL